jgi:hypothetical protein
MMEIKKDIEHFKCPWCGEETKTGEMLNHFKNNPECDELMLKFYKLLKETNNGC